MCSCAEREVRKATRDLNNLLAGMGTPLEKMEALQKKNQDLFADMKRLERDYNKSKKRADQLQKERDAQRTELTRTVGVKDKLEKLAREFTKDNKKLKVRLLEHRCKRQVRYSNFSQDDIRRLEETEKSSRESMSEKHEVLLVDLDRIITKKHGDEAEFVNLRVEDQYAPGDSCLMERWLTFARFRQKFKTFFDQYNLRELHMLSLLRTKETEIHHLVTRLEAQRKFADNEGARSRQLSAQVATFSQTETELRSQLNIYVEKFKQVEDTLNNSNDLFLTFRKEMEDMSKKTKRLEKENLNLTRKQDLTNRNILEMAEERTRVNKEVESLRKKNTTLESVIRRMQEQGRGAGLGNGVDVDEDGTESEYGSEEDEEYEEGSEEEGEYDDETEEDLNMQAGLATSAYAAAPPPPPSSNPGIPNGHVNGDVRNQQRVEL